MRGHRDRPGGVLSVILGALLLLTGCSSFVDSDQTSVAPDASVLLEPGHPVGQTFVARHGGLSGVEFYLAPTAEAQGTVVLHLRESPVSRTDILTATAALPPGGQEGFYRFTFSPILDSHARYYYSFLELDGTGTIEMPAGRVRAYPDGRLYRDHRPYQFQTVFRLTYTPLLIGLDLLLTVGRWTGYGLMGLTTLFLSGYWIVRRWIWEWELDFTPTLILSVVVALAGWMTFLVWADLLGIRLQAISARFLAGAAIVTGIFSFGRDRRLWRRREFWLGREPMQTGAFWAFVLLGIALRLFVGRGVVMLPGSDAYHHTLIVQLFEEQGGIPHSYEPYAPLISYSYHFGFHSVVALLRWLFGTELLTTTKTVALVLNGAIAATAGLLGEEAAGNRRAGVITAALVGLIMVSPFCLLLWGRFTQTAGLLFLGATLAVLVKTRQGNRLLPALLITATMVSHYRIAFFLGLFLAIAAGFGLIQRQWKEISGWTVAGASGLAFALPWLARVAWVQLDPYGLRLTYPVLGGHNQVDRLAEALSFPTNVPVLLGAAMSAGGCWLVSRQRGVGKALVIWCLAGVGIALLLPLMGVPFWDLKTALLSLPVPMAALMGIGGDRLWRAGIGWHRRMARGAAVLMLLVGILVGILRFPGLIYRGLFYLRPGDLVAMEWIEDNTPRNALFIVDAFQYDWSPGWMVGIDAGYWVPLLAHRATTLPPMIYPLEWSDLSRLPAGVEITRRLLLNQEVGNLLPSQLLVRYGVTHALIGYRHGLLTPEAWSSDPGMELVYCYDQGEVLEVTQQVGGMGMSSGSDPREWREEAHR